MLDIGQILPDDAHNDAPTVQEFLEFLKEQTGDGWYVQGYAISPDRDDYRISITGCGRRAPVTEEQKSAFRKFFQHADILKTGKALGCWYD